MTTLKKALIISVLIAVVGGIHGVRQASRLRKQAPTLEQQKQALSFADLTESAIPGRYKWIEPGQESLIELLEDHTFIDKDGHIAQRHRWELTAQSLSIAWFSSSDFFTNIEAEGIYSGTKANGRPIRLEKQATSNESAWPPSPHPGLATAINSTNLVASLNLDDQGETNRLVVVNTGNGDGRIFTSTVDGAECFQLVRKSNRPEAYLYVRIDSELKIQPFTNAAVLVEYFDVPTDRRGTGFISIEYDAPSGPYTRLSQRVRLTGTEKWKQAIFFLDNPLFQNRQNAGGDFRLCAVNPELSVRSIKLAKNIP